MTEFDEARHVDAMDWPRRGGFWRRLVASLIDYLVIVAVLYSLVAVLFLLTDGGVKGSFWLNWRICQSATVHGNASLDRYNWQVCRTSLLGLTVAEWAVGTNSNSQSGETPTISIDLDPQGNFRPEALDLGFLEFLVLVPCLFVSELKSGRSIGKRVMALMVHDQNDKSQIGLSVPKAARRQAMKFLGPLSMTLTGTWFAFRAWGSAPGIVQDFSGLEVVCASVAVALTLIWPIWIGLSIALGNEPIHDRFAATTVRVHEAHE
ncbi:RDD family protein [Mesorhizobium sp.]|uniref:RDD family protein n=1 Tax=Mesorhizobium sp. TaxID=1871066 RepID=UPI000FE48CEE|nr:RDD family protein [Mesorhizobium sp.]RWM24789.1 MAG: hypothetical protein EOR74_22690 [Mesorhizobium sp.]RWM37866.1 MAG: hypothetical protein EOR75_19480 [Mesorhizobium sp.]TIO75425.1 MAG: hypothetical protein E5X75_19425 [Mesorhizobium sp.]TIO82732.1 MAG: hypothetical protein E5X74_23130 [Mesorhizobium sp.]TJV49575.1 MAG: hypothetical protein E5Y01_22940 [Mesorhizobium sp.]